MKLLQRFRFGILILLGALSMFAAPGAGEAYTPKELAQGYSDRVVLAKPRSAAAGTLASTERREKVRIREQFARFGDLRVIEVPDGETVEGMVKRLRATGQYEFVEPDALMKEDATPNDPSFTMQWALNNTGQISGGVPFADIQAKDAWDIVREAPNVIVAMIDNGVRLDHQDIAPNLWRNPSPTFGDVNGAKIIRGVRSGDPIDETGHGTHTAGIVAAAGNNGIGTAGVVWKLQLMPLKNAGPDGVSAASDSAALLDYAVAKGANIVNCSFGGSTFSQTFITAIRAARAAGVIVVCASGNDGVNADTTPHYPSSYLVDNIVTVGNSTPADTASTSSNYGASVDLYAPGTTILSADFASANGVVYKSGTSMAAPHVAGTLALLKARFPNDTYRQLINRVLRGVELRTSLAGRAQTNGRLNVYRALLASTNRPANDDFATRFLITGSTLALRANNRGATRESAEPSHAGTDPSGTLWWQWVAPATATMALDTAGSDFDTVLAVYTGSALSSLTQVAASDNDGTNQTSRLAFSASAGTSYFFAVGGKSGAEGYAQLNLGIVPANDNFAGAIALNGESVKATGRNLTATVENGEPRILGNPGSASLWYKWNAPRSGRYQASAFSFDFDTLLAVYTGASLDKLTLVAASDDTDVNATITNSDSRCVFDAVAGTTYYLQVDSKVGAVRGEVVVTITDALWQFTTGGEITTSPAIAADGTIYIGSGSPDRRLYALNQDGELKWTYAASGNLDIGSAAIAPDGTVYQGSLDGKLAALTPAGSVRWVRDFGAGSGAAITPAIAADGTLYLHTDDGYINALNPADGSTKWRYNVNAKATFASAVIASDGTIYQGSDDQNLYALNADGTLKWRFAAGGTTFTTPAIDAAGNIYYATYTNPRLFSIAPDGTQRWSYAGLGGATSGSPVLSADGKSVYIGSSDKKLHAVDTATGAAQWTFTAGDSIFATSPVVDSNGVIYIGAYDGKLYAVTSGGALKRSWDTAEPIRSSPAIFGTILYVGSRDAKLYAINIGATAAGGSWPQYRQNPRHLGRIVADPLAITTQPLAKDIAPGQQATLRANATGQGPLTFQWRKDGVAIAGATQATYAIPNPGASSAGFYSVVVSGPQGTITSNPAMITYDGVTFTGRLINLSILSSLPLGGDSFTMGYVVGGANTSGTKSLLIRAAGPSLGALGVPGTLDDPKLELFAGTTLTGQNDNWGGGADLASAMAALGAFPYVNPTSRDAAALASIATRDNSVKISANGSGTGTVIAEIYDNTASDAFKLTTPRLINVSVLKNIGTSLTAGFVVGGRTAQTILIRAIGPGLSAFGVTSGFVADPQLTLYGAGSAKLGENDNWGGGKALGDAFTAVGAFPLANDSRDAALLVTLEPGTYSVDVKPGSVAASGLALVEVYEVP